MSDLLATSSRDPRPQPWLSRKNVFGRAWAALSGAIGAAAGVAPHVLHHVGPIAGAALISGFGGTALFGAIGFVLIIPMLLRLKRRFDSWLVPGIALGIFAAMFTVSTLWIGPAIRGSDDADDSDGHEQHHTIARPVPA